MPKTIPIDGVTDWLSLMFQRLNNAVPTGEDIDGSLPLLYKLSTGSSTVYAMSMTFNPSATAFPNLAYNDGLVVFMRAHVTCGASPTLNINAIAAKDIVLPSGAKVSAADFELNDLLILLYDATADNFIYTNYAKGAAISQGQYKNLVIVAGGTPDEQVDVDADEVILEDTAGRQYRAKSINLTLSNLTDLDTGSVASSTFYFIWLFFNPTTSALSGKLSLSSTAPTAPAGSTFKALVGAIPTDGSSDFIPITQNNNHVKYDVNQTIKDGSFSTGAWTSQSVATIFPTTAQEISMGFGSNNNPSTHGLSHRSDGNGGSYFQIATSSAGNDFGGVAPTARNAYVPQTILNASTIYYYTEGADATLFAVGWKF